MVGLVDHGDLELDEGVPLLQRQAHEVLRKRLLELEDAGGVRAPLDVGDLVKADVEGGDFYHHARVRDRLAEEIIGADGSFHHFPRQVPTLVRLQARLELRQHVALYLDRLLLHVLTQNGADLVGTHVYLVRQNEIGAGDAELGGLHRPLEDLVPL